MTGSKRGAPEAAEAIVEAGVELLYPPEASISSLLLMPHSSKSRFSHFGVNAGSGLRGRYLYSLSLEYFVYRKERVIRRDL